MFAVTGNDFNDAFIILDPYIIITFFSLSLLQRKINYTSNHIIYKITDKKKLPWDMK